MLLRALLIWSLIYTTQAKWHHGYVKFEENRGACNLTSIGYALSGEDASKNKLSSTIAITQDIILKKLITSSKLSNFTYMNASVPGLTNVLSKLALSYLATLETIFSITGLYKKDSRSKPKILIVNSLKQFFTSSAITADRTLIPHVKEYTKNCDDIKYLLQPWFNEVIYLWLNCMDKPKTSRINDCQYEVLMHMRSLTPNFLYFWSTRKPNDMLKVCFVKHIEIGLFRLRDFIFLNIIIYETVIRSYEFYGDNDQKKVDYLLQLFISDITRFKAYIKWAFQQIENTHLLNKCSATSRCSESAIFEGNELVTRHLTDSYTCSCNFDQTLDKQLCYSTYLGYSGNIKPRHSFYLATGQERNAAISEALRNLTAASLYYNLQIQDYLKAFWDNEFMNLSPTYDLILHNARMKLITIRGSKGLL